MSASDDNPTWRALHRAACRDTAARIETTFDALERWTDASPELLDFRPHPGVWTARGILEHVTLADRYLLVLVRKIADKSARRVQRGEPWPAEAPRPGRLETLAARDARWPHPEHMTPGGTAAPEGLRATLRADREECLAALQRMPAGEGTLHRIRMSRVHNDDRLDLYAYLELIELHARRHLVQLDRNRAGYERDGESPR